MNEEKLRSAQEAGCVHIFTKSLDFIKALTKCVLLKQVPGSVQKHGSAGLYPEEPTTKNGYPG
jgi:hypothetical protein